MVSMLAVAVLLLGVAAWGEPAQLWLEWSRAALAGGEWWRLLTGHLVHLDLAHAALNVAALLLLWYLFGAVFTPRALAAVLLAGLLAIDAMLWWLGDVDQYRGLSGLLHVFAAAAVVRRIIERCEPTAWAIAIFGLGKILLENLAGAMPFMRGADAVVTDVHLAGVIAGMAAGLLVGLQRR